MKKRWVILLSNILSNILSIILIAISLSGCKWFWRRDPEESNPEKIAYKEGELYYYVKDDSAIILDVDYSLKEREELVIPETLGGYPVKQIGDYQQKGIMGGSKYFYGIGAKNIKKIVLNHDCYLFDCGIKQFDGDIIVNANVYVLSSGYRNYESSEKIDGKYIAANNIQINVEFEKYYRFNLFCYEQANDIKYEAMGGNLRTFHTIVRDGCYLNLPQDPVRDGYNFVGWFKEEECLNEWNFDEDIVEEDITLYAKWIEV